MINNNTKSDHSNFIFSTNSLQDNNSLYRLPRKSSSSPSKSSCKQNELSLIKIEKSQNLQLKVFSFDSK